MGHRENNFLNHDDDQADAAMRHSLEQGGYLLPLEPPPDLVTRTLRRLPAASPAVAARTQAGARLVQTVGWSAVILAVACVAMFGIANWVGVAPQLALLFGDGSSGVSRALLMLHLFAKPLLGTLSTVDPRFVVGGMLLAIGSAVAWWTLIRRTPVQATVEIIR